MAKLPAVGGGVQLRINADTLLGGSVTVSAIEDGHKTPDSLPFSGNETAATVMWPSGGKMASLQGKTIQLQATLGGEARLYSLRGNFVWK